MFHLSFYFRVSKFLCLLYILHDPTNACPSTCRCKDVWGSKSVKCTQMITADLIHLPEDTMFLELAVVSDLKELSSDNFFLPNLKSLTLTYTRLEKLHLTTQVPILKSVRITGGLFKHYSHIRIDGPLDYLMLVELPLAMGDAKYSFRNIRNLYFERNFIQNFDSAMFNLSEVKSIVLKNNPLTHFTMGENVKKMSIVQLDSCHISNFEDLKIETPSIKYLQVDRNSLKSPSSFADYGSLRFLSLSENNITAFKSKFFSLSQQETFDLRKNSFG